MVWYWRLCSSNNKGVFVFELKQPIWVWNLGGNAKNLGNQVGNVKNQGGNLGIAVEMT